MIHRMKSGALTLSLIALAACSDTAGLESSFEESLTLDVAMIAADATIEGFGDLGLLFAVGCNCNGRTDSQNQDGGLTPGIGRVCADAGDGDGWFGAAACGNGGCNAGICEVGCPH